MKISISGLSPLGHMPTRIVGGYPYQSCGCWKIERKIEYTYHWVDFGILLVEKATIYICQFCKHILVQALEHWEEKSD